MKYYHICNIKYFIYLFILEIVEKYSVSMGVSVTIDVRRNHL